MVSHLDSAPGPQIGVPGKALQLKATLMVLLPILLVPSEALKELSHTFCPRQPVIHSKC